MSDTAYVLNKSPRAPKGVNTVRAGLRSVAWCIAASAISSAVILPASAATLTRSVVVQGAPAAVWTLIGPFCAIRDWLPPVGTCSEDGGSPPIRTLVTKDGKATFVEQQMMRSEMEHFYSYTFLSSPLPVTHYSSTIKVASIGEGQSVVIWHGTYSPNVGMEQEAEAALDGIYAAGLESIRILAAKQFAPESSTDLN